MRRSRTIRQSLLQNLLLVVILLSGAILLTTAIGVRRAVRRLSGTIIEGTLVQTELELRRFFDPVRRELLLAESWIKTGVLDEDDADDVERLLTPIIDRFRQISSLMIADDRGREVMLLRTATGWTRRETRADEWAERTRWKEWTDDGSEPTVTWRDVTYDPRGRPWFTAAMDTPADSDERVRWTPPYTFFTTKEPGITASVALPHETHTYVLGFDILLNDITDFTTSLRPGGNGFVVVLSEDGRLLGLPANAVFDDDQARMAALLKRPDEIGLGLATDANHAFTSPKNVGKPMRFKSEGAWWWGQTTRLHLAPQELWIAVVVSEDSVLGGLGNIRTTILTITVVVLIASVMRVLSLARGYSEPIEALVADSVRMSRGDLSDGEPIESSVEEMRDLAAAHNRMRVGLRSLMRLERDLQIARQIQQGTFPDALPALAGFDLVAWSEPADETGGDTYDVIGRSANSVLFLLADATGHGIGPALSVTQVRAMLRMAVRMGGHLPEIAAHLNEQLCADLPESRFITTWLGDLDAAAGTLWSFSGGQGPLLHLHAMADEVEVLHADTLPFGILEDLTFEVPAPRQLDANDVFAVLSDGIFEAASPTGELFGTERVCAILRQNREQDAGALLDIIRRDVATFTEDAPADDDRTAIIIKRTA